MSELRIALVVEGPTDTIIIEAALKAILPRATTFVLTTLQPEPTLPKTGTGWGGVLRWCRAFAEHGVANLEADATLWLFDAFILHLDADVAEKSYEDCGQRAVDEAKELLPLPCSKPCPPASASVDELEKRVLSWLGINEIGPNTVLCIPSKASEAWLAAAVFPAGHKVLKNLECNVGLETALAALPKSEKITKTTREYQAHSKTITTIWKTVVSACTQAARFESDVKNLACFAANR